MKTTLGKILKKKRELKGLSQKELSLKLGYETAQYISNIERNVSLPPTKKLKKLSKILDIDKHFLYEAISQIELAKLRKDLGI